jgi:quercetin dioxygenase-like cupin family protein
MKLDTHEHELALDAATNRRAGMLIDAKQGAVKGFCMGTAYYDQTAYREPGVHDDQEGFYVLEGTGTARVGDQEFRISPGSAFIAAAGVPHTMKRDLHSAPIKVLWSHGAV